MVSFSYFQSPSRFPINTAYVEGWALYGESLGFDMDLYSDPYDRYGHYSAEIFRACRLVVDTGLHAMNWTWQQAVDFMLEHSASSREHVEGEINRYVYRRNCSPDYLYSQKRYTFPILMKRTPNSYQNVMRYYQPHIQKTAE